MATATVLRYNPLPDYDGSSFFLKLDPPCTDMLKRDHTYVIAMQPAPMSSSPLFVLTHIVPATPDGRVKVLYDLHSTMSTSASPLTTALADMGYDLIYPEAQ